MENLVGKKVVFVKEVSYCNLTTEEVINYSDFLKAGIMKVKERELVIEKGLSGTIKSHKFGYEVVFDGVGALDFCCIDELIKYGDVSLLEDSGYDGMKVDTIKNLCLCDADTDNVIKYLELIEKGIVIIEDGTHISLKEGLVGTLKLTDIATKSYNLIVDGIEIELGDIVNDWITDQDMFVIE